MNRLMMFGDLFIRHAMHRNQWILEDVHRDAGLGVVFHRLVMVTVALKPDWYALGEGGTKASKKPASCGSCQSGVMAAMTRPESERK